MASKRAKKHRVQVKQEQSQKQALRQQERQRYQPVDPIQQAYNKSLSDYKRKIKIANRRLLRLEKAGLQNVIYTITTNALGATRFRMPKNLQELNQFTLILNKFLAAKTSTTGAAKKAAQKNKSDFATFLNRATGGKLSEDIANKLAAQLGNLELKELLKVYVYNEIRDAFLDLGNAGITPTSDNLKRTLNSTIEDIIIDTLNKQNVTIPADIQTEVLNTARLDGIQAAIDLIEEYKRGEKRIDGGDNDDVYPF